MVEIKGIEDLKTHNFNIVKKRTKKTQIFLFDTQRRTDDYISKIKYRKNGKYEDIPHFIVTKTGQIYKIFNPNYYSTTFGDVNVDKRFIKIAIENLGWLKKNTIIGILNNWIDDPYRSEPFIKTWRGHYFWDKYTEEQMNSTVKLCSELCTNFDIPYQTVPSQGYIENLTHFKGIVCKSNFHTIYTDINPSFDFKVFYKDGK